MNDKTGGWWSYFWGAITGVLSAMTLQDLAFAGGVVVTAIFTYLTYRSNDKKNKAAIEADKERTRIMAEWAKSQAGRPPEQQASSLQVITEQIDKAEAEA